MNMSTTTPTTSTKGADPMSTSDAASMPAWAGHVRASSVSELSDSELQTELEAAFAERRRIDATIVRLSGEAAHRSRAELGAEGLARRCGTSNASVLVASIGLIGMAEAGRFCRVGVATTPRRSLTGEPLPAPCSQLAAAVDDGSVSVEAAAHISSQLDQARARASVEDLLVAERELVAFAEEAIADDVRRLAIRWRDALDVDGIEPREEELVAARSLKRIVLPSGMKRFVIDLDPLSAAYLDTAIDAEVTASIHAVRFQLTSDAVAQHGDDPCHADPRQHDPDSHEVDSQVVDSHGVDHQLGGEGATGDLGPDPRTIAQMSADAIVDLARHALGCEQTTPSLATATVVVRMTQEALVSGLGEAQLDGGEQPISAGTARRLAAGADLIPMVLGGPSEVLDLGRRRRMFSRAQRIALAERDGGCAVSGCNRPPLHTEAHHIGWWKRDRGRTDLANGVLLCTRDHHRIHSQGWEIRVEKGAVWFIPPPTIDPLRRPRRGSRHPAPEPTPRASPPPPVNRDLPTERPLTNRPPADRPPTTRNTS